MAIAFDSASISNRLNTTDRTFNSSHTVTTSGSDRVLIVAIYTGQAKPQDVISSVKYDDVSMTRLTYCSQYYGGTYFGVAFYYLVNPSTGTNNITVATSANYIGLNIGGISLTGVDQTNPYKAYNTNTSPYNAEEQTASISLTTQTDNSWIVSILGGKDGTDKSWTFGSGQTSRINKYNDYQTYFARCFCSTELKSTAGSDTQSFTANTIVAIWGMISVEIQETQISGPAKLKTRNGLAAAKIKTINGLTIAKTKTINGLA